MSVASGQNQIKRQIASIARLERARMSRQLHDGLSQQIAAVAMLAESLKQRLAHEGSPQVDMAIRVLTALEEAKQQARALSNLVAPIMAEGECIIAALGGLAQQACSADVHCVFEYDGLAPRIGTFTAEQLVYFARDAISFLCNGGQQSRLSMRLTSDEVTALAIRGDCLPSAPDSRRSDENLQILHVRARLIEGEFSIENSERGGTVITCIVPSGSSTFDFGPNTP